MLLTGTEGQILLKALGLTLGGQTAFFLTHLFYIMTSFKKKITRHNFIKAETEQALETHSDTGKFWNCQTRNLT
jgi:hypothetical protein